MYFRDFSMVCLVIVVCILIEFVVRCWWFDVKVLFILVI